MSDCNDLNNIFDQILHSEKEAQAKRSLLLKLKNEIQKTQIAVTDAKEESLAIRGQMFIKNQNLSEENVSLEHERNKSQILQERNLEIIESINTTKKTAGDLEDLLDKIREDFCEEANTFREEFGFPQGERKAWEEEMKKNLGKLREEEIILMQEIDELKKRQNERDAVSQQKIAAEKELDQMKRILRDTNQQMKISREKLRDTKEKKLQVTKIPHYDPEFQRLRLQLEKLKASAVTQSAATSVEPPKRIKLEQRKNTPLHQNNISEYFFSRENNFMPGSTVAGKEMPMLQSSSLRKQQMGNQKQQKWKFHQLKMHQFLFPGKNSQQN